MPKQLVLTIVVCVGACLLMPGPGIASGPGTGPEAPPFVAWQLPDKPTEKWFIGPGQVTPSLDDLSPQPGQEVKSLHLDLARNEKESACFLVSGLQDAEVTVAITGPDIFAKTVLFTRSREVNMLIPLKGPLKLKKGKTEELWMRFSSHKVEPDVYKGAIEFKHSQSGKSLGSLPVMLKVWKVVMPPRNIVHCTGYSSGIGFINGLSGNPDKDEAYKKRLHAYLANMAETRLDSLAISINKFSIYDPVKINGTPLQAVLRSDPSLLKGDTLPQVDFSYYDTFFAIAMKYGFKSISFMGPQSLFIGPLACLGKEVTVDTSEGRRCAVWLAGEWRKYLQKQGFKAIWAKENDEIKPDEIPSYNKICDIFKEGGWRTYTTWTGTIPKRPDLIRKVNKNAVQWQMQLLSLDIFRNLVAKQPALIDRTDEVRFYGGGNGVYRFSYLYVRLYGWLAGYYDTDGFAWYVYCDWHKNETIAVLKDGVVYSTPALEGLRDAIEDAQLYAMLNRKLLPRADKRQWAPGKYSHGLVAKGGGVLLPLEKLTYGAYVFYGFRSPTPDTVRQAKAKLLRTLEK